MCRFGSCILSKQQLSKKCSYKKNNEEYDVPWITEKNFVDYSPSTFLQPKSTGLPVIIDGKHLDLPADRVFCPMYWTFIPSYYKGGVKEWSLTTYNARVENLESKFYSTAWSSGRRCVVTLEGFYEYKRYDSQPAETYYFQSMDGDLLKAAGLFSALKLPSGENLHTCTVITTESDSNLGKIHHRMPLLLHSEQDIEAWINFRNVSSSDALSKIKEQPFMSLKYHKTKGVGLTEPTSDKKNTAASKNIMSNWLNSKSNQGQKRKRED